MITSSQGGASSREPEGNSSSDYRGDVTNNIMSPTDKIKNISPTPSMNYAQVTKSDAFPKRDQAIILQAIEGISIKEYTFELAKVIKSENIRFISKISNSRVCVYLSSKSLVDDLIENKQTINVNNHSLTVKPLASRAKRIILSNVCPEIPHGTIEQRLKQMKIRLESPVSFIRAGMSDTGFSHIFSFRRQVLIHPEDADIIPDSLIIEYEKLTFRIFISSEGVSCFIYKKQGHLAKNCSLNQTNSSEINNINTIDNNTDNLNNHSPRIQDYEENNAMEISPIDNINTNKTKRPLSTSTSSCIQVTNIDELDSDSSFQSPNEQDSTQENKDKESFKSPKKKLKKRKVNINKQRNVDELLQPAKNLIENKKDRFPLDFNSLKNLIDKTYRNSAASAIIQESTKTPAKVANMMRELYPLLSKEVLKTSSQS